MKLLLAAATEAEIAPTLTFLQQEWTQNTDRSFTRNQTEITICITGVGMMAATFSLTQILLAQPPDFVLQAGIGGAFDTGIPLGSVLAIESEQPGDLGAEDHDDFISIFSLGFVQPDAFPFTGGALINPMQSLPFGAHLPKVKSITVNTVSGAEKTIAMRREVFGAAVESMEGAALHYVCLKLGIPFLQVRAISNYVIPRDRSQWKIGPAIAALNAQLTEWLTMR